MGVETQSLLYSSKNDAEQYYSYFCVEGSLQTGV